MKEEFILPNKWCIKAKNKKEAKVIANYANPINIAFDTNTWSNEDSLAFYLHINQGVYHAGNRHKLSDFIEIDFDQFKQYVLNELPLDFSPVVENYDYMIKLLTKLDIR